MFAREQLLNSCTVCHVHDSATGGRWPRARRPPLCSTGERAGDLAACEVCGAKTSESNNWLHRLIKGREIDRNGRGGVETAVAL